MLHEHAQMFHEHAEMLHGHAEMFHGHAEMFHGHAEAPRLQAHQVTLAYNRHVVARDVSLDVPVGGFTAIIGPNGCGKSTLVRALGRILRPVSGSVTLNGRSLAEYPAKEIAKSIALLPQSPTTPSAIAVGDLVSRGRFAHQSFWRQWSADDAAVVDHALGLVGMREHADALVEELSGGQRQRVWIAMALAQDTPILLLDEPTTFLDVVHQLDVLDLCARLHAQGRTLVAVLHDLNLAARYATHIVAMKDGAIIVQGSPTEVITEANLGDVFGLDAAVVADPETGTPHVVPRGRQPFAAEASPSSLTTALSRKDMS